MAFLRQCLYELRDATARAQAGAGQAARQPHHLAVAPHSATGPSGDASPRKRLVQQDAQALTLRR